MLRHWKTLELFSSSYFFLGIPKFVRICKTIGVCYTSIGIACNSFLKPFSLCFPEGKVIHGLIIIIYIRELALNNILDESYDDLWVLLKITFWSKRRLKLT